MILDGHFGNLPLFPGLLTYMQVLEHAQSDNAQTLQSALR